MIILTETAKSRIQDLIIEENNPQVKLRVFVQGGGCSGMQYGFTFDEDINEDDFVIDNMLIDSISAQYLTGATIDYKDDIMGSNFVITNPNAQTTCGCGSSFSVDHSAYYN
jgi:iron-sulfur cluster insertion protein